MKRLLAAVIVIISLLAVSCGVEFLSEEENVNDYIYPFLEFMPDEDGEGYVVTVVGGAELEEIYIPAEVEVDGVTVQVTSFGGFENPEDAKSLKVLELASSETTIKENALEKAENIKDIKVDSEKEGAVWGELSHVEKPGYEFDGWYIVGTDIRVNKGDRMIHGLTTIEPRWKNHVLVFVEEIKATCTSNGTKAHYICSNCGKIFLDADALYEVTEKDLVTTAGHTMTYEHDFYDHWWHCSVCGYESRREPHTLTGEQGKRICEECGYSETESQNDSGSFDIQPIDREPHGTLSALKNGTTWTFTLTSTNPDAVPDTYMWYVDNRKVDGEETNIFVLSAPGKHTYKVMCVFKAGSEYSSETMTITGGE